MSATSAANSEPKPGDVVGNYLLTEELGRDGMGIVFSALSTPAYSTVPLALKGFRPKRASSETVREVGSCLAQLHHSALVQVTDVDRHGRYLVMEHISGEPLGPLLKRRGRLTCQEFEVLTRHLCDGLSTLHGAGLLHLDVRPVNNIATRHGWVLIDLGIPYFCISTSEKAVDLSKRGPRSY